MAAPSMNRRSRSDEPEGSPPRVATLPFRAKLDRLLQVARGHKKALILTHDNPDPDSLASAVALAHLLETKAGVEARVGYGGIIGRAENIAFVKVLRLPVSPISQIVFDEYDPNSFLTSVWQCVGCFQHDKLQWKQLIQNGMREDRSWKRSAGEYAAIYERALGWLE